MNAYDQENEHFRMRLDGEDDEPPVSASVATVDDLRLEKLNNRVTVISVLIPVLIAVVVVVTYLDIKKQVVQTEDTGTMSVQSLSTDVESRFSSLSVRQAKLEEDLSKMTGQNDQSFAGIQVKLNKLEESLAKLSKNTISSKELDAAAADITKKIRNVSAALEEQEADLVSLSEQLQTSAAVLKQAATSQRDQKDQLDILEKKLNELQESIVALQRDKIDKPSMDIALRLESLKTEQKLQARIEELEARLEKLGKTLSQRSQIPAPKPAGGGSQSSAAKPATTAPGTGSPSKNGIKEQTIPR
jgi:DNA repair exonuclease SbcCD ATPase subunit